IVSRFLIRTWDLQVLAFPTKFERTRYNPTKGSISNANFWDGTTDSSAQSSAIRAVTNHGTTSRPINNVAVRRSTPHNHVLDITLKASMSKLRNIREIQPLNSIHLQKLPDA